MTSTRPAVRTITALAVALGLALTGCTPSNPNDPDLPPEADLQLSPEGNEGAWFDPAYAAGLGDQYATPNEICAVTDDVVVEFQRGPVGTSTVLGRALTGGAVQWQLEDAMCDRKSFLPPEAETTRPAAVLIGTGQGTENPRWSLFDPATGRERQKLGVSPGAAGVTPLTWVDDMLVAELTDSDIVGLRGEDEVWRLPISSGATVTVLADGFLGVTERLGGPISVIDANKGAVTMTRTVADAFDITWASDGYVQNIQETDPEYAYYDLRGNEVDRTKGVSQYPFVPQPYRGVTFPVADHRKAGTVVGVSADGTPALFEAENGRTFTQAGELEDLPGSVLDLVGVSTDGSLLLFETSDGLVIRDDDGKMVGQWPLDYSELRIESGLIIVSGALGTAVLLPSAV